MIHARWGADIKMFEVFSGTGQREAVWQCAVEAEEEAIATMKRLAHERPGPYFVFHVDYGEIVALHTEPPPKIGANSKRKSTAA
jgi:hypothetical protein